MRRYIFGQFTEISFTSTVAKFIRGNRILSIQGENYVKYIYPIFEELYSYKTIDELYSKLNSNLYKENFENVLEKMVKLDLLKLEEQIDIIPSCNIIDYTGSNYSDILESIFRDCIKEVNPSIVIVLVNRYNLYKLQEKYQGLNCKYFLPVVVDDYFSFYTCISKYAYLDDRDGDQVITYMIDKFQTAILDRGYISLNRGNYISLLGEIYKEVINIINFEEDRNHSTVGILNSIVRKNNLINKNSFINVGRNPAIINELETILNERR